MQRTHLRSIGWVTMWSLIGFVSCDTPSTQSVDGDLERVAHSDGDDKSMAIAAYVDDYRAARDAGNDTVACIRTVQILEATDRAQNEEQYRKWKRIEGEVCAHLDERHSDHNH